VPALIVALAMLSALVTNHARSAPNNSEWLAPLPREFVVEYLPGTTRVNGVGLRLAVARAQLPRDEAQQAIAASWQEGDEPLGMQRIAESLVVSRRVGQWHDTATVATDPQGGTRVTFSRLDLRERVAHVQCAIRLPRRFVLRSVTESQVGAADALQCVYSAQLPRRSVLRILDAELPKQGWRAIGSDAWERRARVLRVSTVDGVSEALVVLLSMPRGLP
jgi:hypothetical protein